MEFRRINSLPPYVFTIIDTLKMEARRAGEDVIDLGFGNPDLPSPDVAVDKLCEAARNPRNHRYSSSRGLPNLRQAVADLYLRRFGVVLDPETQVLNTIGAKEGFAHLMWVLLQPGDAALVPSPSYPIHRYSPLFAGAEVREMPFTTDGDFIAMLKEGWEYSWPRPRVIVLSFPHNPTTACVDLAFMEEVVAFARERDVVLVHDFAYADLGFDGYRPPSILQVPGADEVAVELYSMTKSYSMAGWRVAFALGNEVLIRNLRRLKSYLDYGVFTPIQVAAIVALESDYSVVRNIAKVYEKRRNHLVDGLNRVGWKVKKPKATMFVWAKIPEYFTREKGMDSLEFSKFLLYEAGVAVSPGIGFGKHGEGWVRFALVENEMRIKQAVRGIRRAFRKAGFYDAGG